jgi:hypothetical protein
MFKTSSYTRKTKRKKSPARVIHYSASGKELKRTYHGSINTALKTAKYAKTARKVVSKLAGKTFKKIRSFGSSKNNLFRLPQKIW